MLIVSACLAGVKCKYNAGDNLVPLLVELVSQGEGFPVCPEQLGGLSTPRPPSEIQDGTGRDVLLGNAKVMTKEGIDVTEAFLRGAQETLRLAELIGAKGAVLKEGSPSCGSSLIYDGSFRGQKRQGSGVTAALIREKGLKVFSEHNFPAKVEEGEDEN